MFNLNVERHVQQLISPRIYIMSCQSSVNHVVVDSGAFIRNAPVQNIGKKIYTIPEVVKEIKDKATLQRLQVLPYQIEYRTPSQESLQCVSNFAKKTGDYKSLSAVDIKLMALTYQLEKEFVGTDHIKSVPEKKIEWNTTTKLLEKPTDIAGFYLSSKKNNSRTTSISDSTSKEGLLQESCETVHRTGESCDLDQENKTPCNTDNLLPTTTLEIEDKNQLETIDMSESNSEQNVKSQFPGEGETIQVSELEEEEDDDYDEEDDDDEEEDDDVGWITPSNIKDVKQKMGQLDSEEADVMVGCLTTDFAIQNVLIQMGLNVISIDGMLIKKAKSYVLRCFACMKITTNILKEFCPFCGNNTLRRVAMTVEEDGSIHYYLSRRKNFSTRGMKYSLPLPKGGKHANNPVLCEDQPMPQQRASKKSKQKLDVFDPDYVAGYSPFAVTDITSRAAQLGIRAGRTGHFNKRNPNEVRKHYGRRK